MSIENFLNEPYQRHNRRRQEHLASLRLPLSGKRVLEFGAGIGDHTSFLLDRGCTVTVTDAPEENVRFARTRFLPRVNGTELYRSVYFALLHCLTNDRVIDRLVDERGRE
jgi:2-polyprenyl-3-methyl-5-hydroxy-6-metoxy-1,4-benzoquinol methylase